MLIFSVVLVKYDCSKLRKLFIKMFYYWHCQHNRAWFSIWMGEGSVVISTYLFQWSMVMDRGYTCSLIIK